MITNFIKNNLLSFDFIINARLISYFKDDLHKNHFRFELNLINNNYILVEFVLLNCEIDNFINDNYYKEKIINNILMFIQTCNDTKKFMRKYKLKELLYD